MHYLILKTWNLNMNRIYIACVTFVSTIILLVVANQVCATDYIAVDLNPSGFIEAYAEGISGSQQVG